MKVQLINYTQDALELLLLTKQTRLERSRNPNTILDEIRQWSEEKKKEQLDYMLKTIQSSWEFVDYVFHLEGVSRAFTHQFVRTRTGSYAQQSQRTVDVGEFDFVMPTKINKGAKEVIAASINRLQDIYRSLIHDLDTPPQDARSILPTNNATSITAKFNLRTLSEMSKKRLCPRTQGEYQDIFKAMRNEVIRVHPWTEPFLRVYCAAVGVCQFPNFKECPIKDGLFNPATGFRWDEAKDYRYPNEEENLGGRIYFPATPNTLEQQQKLWEGMDYEATPKWKGRS